LSVRPESRWWILTGVVVLVLVGLSVLALSHPAVVWHELKPHCPHCRHEVQPYSQRCASCQQEYEWVVAPDEESPLSHWSLSALENEHVRRRVAEIGKEEAERRIAARLGLSPEAAGEYLTSLSWGRCGWCGGSGRDLATPGEGEPVPCPVCFGRQQCIACDGDRRMRLGDAGAASGAARYRAAMADLADSIPADLRRAEAQRLTRQFVLQHHGTVQTTEVWFWPDVASDHAARALERSRARLDACLEALEGGT
jgi:hypothetical protein